ncbi:MAG: hypothetical protein U1E83_05995 [Methylotetracoccus sp.]
MGKKLRRKPCDGTQCQDPAFFNPPRAAAGVPFFTPNAGGAAPAIQKEDAPDAPKKEEEKKDPTTEGLKITAEQLLKHKPFKAWLEARYQPLVGKLKLDLWDNASVGEKVMMLSFAGVNLGMAVLAFSQSEEFRKTLSGTNIGAPLGWIPYSPIEGFKYKLPAEGKSELGLSADFTLDPYLDLWKNKPWYAPNSATLGLESNYDLSGKGGFKLQGANASLGFFGDALKLQGGFFDSKTISHYPLLVPGVDGAPPGRIMKEIPGMPDMKTGPGWQVGANLDLWRFPRFRKFFGAK